MVTTPIPGGQWVKGTKGRSSSSFCENSGDPNIPVAGQAGSIQLIRGDQASAALVEAAGVRKRFGALTVIDGVDFVVGEGDAVGIVGPNGAGKTTLLNIISGSLRADGGTVRFAGRTSPARAPTSAAGSGSAAPTRCPSRSPA